MRTATAATSDGTGSPTFAEQGEVPGHRLTGEALGLLADVVRCAETGQLRMLHCVAAFTVALDVRATVARLGFDGCE